jgi:hypothetical protein
MTYFSGVDILPKFMEDFTGVYILPEFRER